MQWLNPIIRGVFCQKKQMLTFIEMCVLILSERYKLTTDRFYAYHTSSLSEVMCAV